MKSRLCERAHNSPSMKILFESIRFAEIEVFCGSEDDLINVIGLAVKGEAGLAIQFSAAHGFVEANNSTNLRKALNSGITVSDGKPLTVYLKKFKPKMSQIRGTGFMKRMLSETNSEEAHYFLGSTPETLDLLVREAIKINPSIRIVGTLSPPFTDDLSLIVDQSARDIEIKNPDFIWIGLGAPKQFYVAEELSKKHRGAYLSVGAAFGFISGTAKESPRLFQRLGLEWLFRLLHDPVRLFSRYVIGNFLFVGMIIKDLFYRLSKTFPIKPKKDYFQ